MSYVVDNALEDIRLRFEHHAGREINMIEGGLIYNEESTLGDVCFRLSQRITGGIQRAKFMFECGVIAQLWAMREHIRAYKNADLYSRII